MKATALIVARQLGPDTRPLVDSNIRHPDVPVPNPLPLTDEDLEVYAVVMRKHGAVTVHGEDGPSFQAKLLNTWVDEKGLHATFELSDLFSGEAGLKVGFLQPMVDGHNMTSDSCSVPHCYDGVVQEPDQISYPCPECSKDSPETTSDAKIVDELRAIWTERKSGFNKHPAMVCIAGDRFERWFGPHVSSRPDDP